MDDIKATNQRAFAALPTNQEEGLKVLREIAEALKTLAQTGSGLWTLMTFL
jgi:hypothetical protein